MPKKRYNVDFVSRHTAKFFAQAERYALRELRRILQGRFDALGPIVQGVFQGQSPSVVLPGQIESDAFLSGYIRSVWEQGWAHGHAEIDRFKRRQFNYPSWWTNSSGLEAVEWAAKRLALQGKWNRDLDAEITRILVQALDNGESLKTTMKALAQVLPSFTKARLENIVRTETTAAYNQGRVTSFKASEMVGGVQFTAIIDTRTTDICRKRDGLILAIDDPRLQEQTPPLHFQCRSVLVPVDKYDIEDLMAGDKTQLDYYFGWTDKNGPRNWSEATKAWDDAPPPLDGFGRL